MWGRLGAAGFDVTQALADRGELGRRRRALLAPARGRVLEIGTGTGRGLPAYHAATTVLALDRDRHMLRRAARRAAAAPAHIVLVRADAQRLPLPDASVDEVVCSMVLCSVADPEATLAEVRRVLVPGGVLRFYEHVRHDDPRIAAWQRRLRPLWSRLADGCQLDRETVAVIERAGFLVGRVESRDLPGAPAFIRRHADGEAVRSR